MAEEIVAQSMDADAYLKARLEPQIKWYDDKSKANKTRYLACRCIEIVCAAIIPFLSGFAQGGSWRVAVSIGLLGILVAACAGITSLFQFQEHWIKYRTTAESLKKEKYLYLTRGEPYETENPLPILVQRVETLVSQENTNWAQYMMKPAKGEEHG